MRWFKKTTISRKLAVNGRYLVWEPLIDDNGLLATDDAGIIGALERLVQRGVAGVSEIDQDVYEELKKKAETEKPLPKPSFSGELRLFRPSRVAELVAPSAAAVAATKGKTATAQAPEPPSANGTETGLAADTLPQDLQRGPYIMKGARIGGPYTGQFKGRKPSSIMVPDVPGETT